MTFVILIVVLLALAVVFTVTIGLGPLAIVPFLIAIAVAVWFVVLLIKGGPPSRTVRQTRRAHLLGPGGPDDPDA